MRVYHFTTAEFALQDIRWRRLKIATLQDVNDPFELAVSCSDPERREALRAARLNSAQHFGMLCFSTDWHNPVQWSHYADKHRGSCLGFDVTDGFLVPVSYAKSPPELDWEAIGSANGRDEMRRWSTTKYAHWAYEKEWRGFVRLKEADSSGRYFFNFGDQLRLREVIIGPNSPITRREIQQALCGLEGVECFKSRLAFRSYRVVRQRDELRWL